jgi:hypothetical protein
MSFSFLLSSLVTIIVFIVFWKIVRFVLLFVLRHWLKLIGVYMIIQMIVMIWNGYRIF